MDSRYFLVVEDEVLLRETMIELLPDFTNLGVKIIQASNGKEGLEQVETYKPIAIMSDIGMPQMNGLDFLVELRKRGHETPFMVVSAFGDKSNTVKALRLGAFDFIDKPFEEKHLCDSVTNLIQLGIELGKIDTETMAAIENKSVSAEEGLKQSKTKKLRAIMRFQMPSKKEA